MNALGCRFAVGFALLALVGPAAVRADQEPAPVNDREFAARAITAAKADVRLCELAAKQSDNEKVKDFAQKMAKERNQIVDQLTDLTRGMKIGLDYDLQSDLQAVYDRVAKLQSADFDRAFLKQLVDSNEKAVALFEREAKTGMSADLKTFAKDTLARLKDRLKDARAAADGLKEK